MTLITQQEIEELYVCFKDKKMNIAKPLFIKIFNTNQHYKVSLEFNKSEYLKRSSYMVLKPLFNFLKEKIKNKIPDAQTISWEIVR